MSEEPRPGTNAAIERRLERVELQMGAFDASVGRLDTRMALVEQEQRHARDMTASEFRATNAKVDAVGMKLDQILSMSAQAAAMSANPEESPAGRLVMKAIEDAAVERKEQLAMQQAQIDEQKVQTALLREGQAQISRRLAYAAGAIFVITILVQLIGPAINLANLVLR